MGTPSGVTPPPGLRDHAGAPRRPHPSTHALLNKFRLFSVLRRFASSPAACQQSQVKQNENTNLCILVFGRHFYLTLYRKRERKQAKPGRRVVEESRRRPLTWCETSGFSSTHTAPTQHRWRKIRAEQVAPAFNCFN